MRCLLAALALSLAVATPAAAQGYGPADAVEVKSERQAERERQRREATRWEAAYQVLSVVDAVQTIDCLERRVCVEVNPIYGRNPSKGKIIGVKLIGGVLHYVLFDYIADRDPKAAKVFSKVSVFVQGGVVVANLRFAF